MVDCDFFSDEALDDPFPIYQRLRDESPVHWLESCQAWALSRFEDVWQASEHSENFRAGSANLEFLRQHPSHLRQVQLAEGRSNVNSMNSPDDTVFSARMAPHLTPQRVARFETEIRKTTSECLERVLPIGRCDVIQDLACKVSVKVTCMLIGFPLSHTEYLNRIVNRSLRQAPGSRGNLLESRAAIVELCAYFRDATRGRRRLAAGNEDLLDAVLGVETGGRPLEDDEISERLFAFIIRGTEILENVFAGGILQLFRHPDQRARLAADPLLQGDAFNEILRMEVPTNFLGRVVARDHTFGGQQMRRGQKVLLLLRSANRDDREFVAPETFKIDRCPPRILSFGHGTFFCLGQHAARLAAEVMYEELLDRVPEYHVDESAVVPVRSEFGAGYLSVPITFDRV